jgi:hypothetical protein
MIQIDPLDFVGPATTEEITPAAVETASQVQIANEQAFKEPTSVWDIERAARHQSFAGVLFTEQPSIPPTFDPTFTFEDHYKLIEEAAKTLPPEFLGRLATARSREHFDQLLEYTRKQVEDYKVLSEVDSTLGQLGLFAYQFGIDLIPGVIVGGGATIGSLKAIQRAASVSAAQRAILGTAGGATATGVAAGALGGAMYDVLYGAAGGLSTEDSFLFAVTLGGLMGGLFGPFATRHPHAAGILYKSAAETLKKGPKSPFRTGFGKAHATPDPAPPPPEPPPSSGLPPTVVESPAPRSTAGGAAEVEVPGIGRVRLEGDVAEPILQAGRDLGLLPDETPSAATRTTELNQALKDIDQVHWKDDLEADLRRENYIARAEIDGQEYKIYSEPGAGPAGPYRVNRTKSTKGTGLVAQNLETLDDARRAIFEDSGATPGKLTHPRDPEVKFDTDEQGNALVYRGRTGREEGNEGRVNYTTSREEAKSFGDDVEVVRIPPDQLEQITQIHPNKKYLRLPPELRAAREGAEDAASLSAAKNPQRLDETPELTAQDLMLSEEWRQFMQYAVSAPEKFRYQGFWGWLLNRARYSRGGITVNDPNMIASWLGRHFFNDSIGMPDHTVNPISAMERKDRYSRQAVRRLYNVWGPAFQRYLRDQKVGIMDGPAARDRFYEDVGKYIRETDPHAREMYHPEVRRAGDEGSKVMQDILADLKDPGRDGSGDFRPIPFAELVEDNPHYFSRVYRPDQVHNLVMTHGVGEIKPNGTITGMAALFDQAIADAQPHLPQAVRQKMALGMSRNMAQWGAARPDAYFLAFVENDVNAFKAQLRADLKTLITDDEIETIVNNLFHTQGRRRESPIPHLKRRVFLNEKAEAMLEDFNGVARRVAFEDILDNNAERVMQLYINRMSGWLAMAKTVVRNPEDGTVLLHGVVSPSEFENNVIRQINAFYKDAQGAQALSADGKPRTAFGNKAPDMEQNFRFIYRRILSIPEPMTTSQQRMHTFVNRWRKFHTARLLSNVGIAQLGEYGYPAAIVGTDAFTAHGPKAIGTLRERFARLNRDTAELKNPMYAQIEGIGLAPEALHGGFYKFRGLDEVSPVEFDMVRPAGRGAKMLDNTLNWMEETTYNLSGMRDIQHTQQLHIIGAMSQTLLSYQWDAATNSLSRTPSQGMVRRLHQLGLDTTRPEVRPGTVLAPGETPPLSMLERVVKQLTSHASKVDSVYWGKDGRLASLNLHLWDDLQAKAAFEESMFRMARKLIQEPDASQAAFWMDQWVWKMVFMFRTFALNAWENQFLYNLHMSDWRSAAAFAYATTWAGLVRAAQVQLMAQGRSDKQDYLEKHTSPEALARAGFQRAGWASIIPMIVDTASPYPVFDARSSGQPTGIVFGNPMGSAYDASKRFLAGAARSAIEGRSMTQSEVRAGANLFPFQNALGVSNLLSYMIQSLPERADR